MRILTFIVSMILLALSYQVSSQTKNLLFNQNEELGKIHWYRNYEEAITVAKKENKDIVLLFQEVPGCATCRNYGHNVLSNPLLVEAIENNFIPLCIFNNKGGEDKKILQRFNEPSWNNPVVRIIDNTGKDVVKRISNDYSAITLVNRLKESLASKKLEIPEYLTLLSQELSAQSSNNIYQKHFKMYCFWTGEKQLGKLEGVTNVKAGFIGHNEVVKVSYDNTLIKEEELTQFARKQNFEPIEDDKNYKVATKDVHYYLKNSNYQYIPLLEIQKIKINSALGSNQKAEKYLSPKQKKWLNTIKASGYNKKYVALDEKTIETAWTIMEKTNID